MKHFFCFFLFLVIVFGYMESFSQRSKDGAKIVTTANNIVNEYTSLTANAAAGATSITVANSTLNANGRFPGPLAAGDLLMIIQVQGATILGQPWIFDPNYGEPRDSTWGTIINYNNCGNWEFAEVYSVPNPTTINLDCPLRYNYTASGRVVVIRVPRYSSLTINNGGSITCDSWNGTIGGICAIEVEGNTIINAGGSINVTGRGFRSQLLENLSSFGQGDFASIVADYGAEKGESIAGFAADYTPYGGRYQKGAPANGGGGGNGQNCGGGGGANGGNPALWTGHGVPDVSLPGYIAAWNLQYPGFASQVSSGGGQGGYSFSNNNLNATIVGPNNPAWGGDSRNANGGLGGRPLDYSTGRLFMGGAGGSGDQNDNHGGTGGNAGGMIFLMNYGTVGGSGSIISNGNNGANTSGTPPINSIAGDDGAGGGGAGGTIVINSVGAITGISITANGGKGGDQLLIAGTFASNTVKERAFGPGGGGGGGYVAISNGNPVISVNGGANGVTGSLGLTEFPPNGATAGGAGSIGTITNFTISAPNVTICAGQSATLTATLNGNPPSGTTIVWYDQLVAGSTLGTGNTYITPVLSAGTYTYYVGTCPGTYHQPVVVTVNNSGAISAGNDVTICSGGNVTLTASGGTSYVWTPSSGLSNPNISNPVASPVSSTTYIVSATTPCGNATDTVVVTVNPSISLNITGNTTICAGGSTILTATGGGNYSWNTGSTNASITVSPTTNTTYSVFGGSGNCADTASVTVIVSSGITANISGNTTICSGGNTTLTATGGNNYSWTTGATTSSIIVSPSTNTTYSLIASSGTCTDTTSITVIVASGISASITGNTTICGGGHTTLTASGGNSFSWNTGATTASITISTTGTYSVIVFSGNCSDTVSVNVINSPSMTVSMSTTAIQCGTSNGTATANVSGGIPGYSYLWSPGGQTNSTASGLNAGGTYSVLITDAAGCTATGTINVTALNAPFTSVSGNTLLCIGDQSTLTVSGGNTYTWSTGSTATSIVVSPNTSTTYTVISYIGNCSDTEFVNVQVMPPPNASVINNATICAGSSATLTANGGGNYSWNTGQTNSSISVSPTSTTSYSVVVTIGSCSDTATATVSVVPVPTPTITGTNLTICGGDVTTLSVSGGNTYSWSNGSTDSSIAVAPSSSTTYTIISGNGICTDTATVTVTVLPPPNAVISGNTNICGGNTATLTATGGASYLWSSGETSAVINPGTQGTYSVIAFIGSCTDTAVVNVTVNPNPTVQAFSDMLIIQGQSALLSATGGINYNWSNGMNGASITVSPTVTTVYCVTAYDMNGCYDSACVTVTVELCSNAGTLYLPNAFSPNDDGENDWLQIYYGIMQCIEKFRLVVFNRWGEKIYETNDPSFRWNGIYNSGILKDTQTANTQVFTFYMEADIADGTRITKKGNLSIIR